MAPMKKPHTGSWGTPELGVTEWLGRQIARATGGYAPVTPQGGSNILGGGATLPQNPITREVILPPQAYTPTTGGVVRGVSTAPTQRPPAPSTQRPPAPSPGGGGVEGSYVSPRQDASHVNVSVDDRSNAIRSNIEGAYGQYLSYLDRLSGLVGSQEQEQQKFIADQFTSMASQLDASRADAFDKLNTYRADVEARKSAGIAEIENNLRALARATAMQLGAMGAGSSSASQVVAPYALAKQAARAQSQVISNANAQLAELDRKMIDVASTYDTQKNQLSQWKAEKMKELSSTYNFIKNQIEQSKANAPLQRAEALNRLDDALLNNALQVANQYEQTANQYRFALDSWVRDRIAQLQNYKIQLSQSVNFNPVELTREALRGLGTGEQSQSYEYFNPVLVAAVRKRMGLSE